MNRLTMFAASVFLIGVGPLDAAEVTVSMNAVGADGVGNLLGTIVFMDMPSGLRT